MNADTKWVDLLLEIPAPPNPDEAFHARSEAYVRRVKDLCAATLKGWRVTIRSAYGQANSPVHVDLVFGGTVTAEERSQATSAAQRALVDADTARTPHRKSA